jgi:hypothetical protein
MDIEQHSLVIITVQGHILSLPMDDSAGDGVW